VISISLVSHGQGQLVRQILNDLTRIIKPVEFEVILTKNIPESLNLSLDEFPYNIRLIENSRPKGFGANHNAAFKYARGQWFCVMNPDIRINDNPFPSLLSCLKEENVAVVGPEVVSPGGDIEDSARRFPTPLGLLAKGLGLNDGRYKTFDVKGALSIDWLAGMFMLFRAEDFRGVGGFDEGFFLYYEDVDICARLWTSGRRVQICTNAQVVHDAQRKSHRNLRYLRWHIASIARYLRKHWLRLPHIENHS